MHDLSVVGRTDTTEDAMTVSKEWLAAENARKVRMEAAFALVSPEKFGAKDWRCPIKAYVTYETLAAANVTIEEVKEAVAFFTATEATVKELPGGPFAGYGVTAMGYRAGPAGP
jgi:hypothetical protein